MVEIFLSGSLFYDFKLFVFQTGIINFHSFMYIEVFIHAQYAKEFDTSDCIHTVPVYTMSVYT